MKRISGVRKTTHKLILKAVKDYYFKESIFKINKISQAVMGQKIELSDSEKSDVWAIKINLEDLVYCQSL